MRTAGISASSGVGLALGGWAMQVAFPHVDPIVGKAMLGVAALLLITACVLWLWGQIKGGSVATTSGPIAKTGGDGSPALSGKFRDVYIGHPAPPALPDGPTPSAPYVPNYDNLDGLIRAIGASGRPLTEPHGHLAPKADFSFAGVLVRVYAKLGGAPDKESLKREFYDKVDRELSKGVRENRISMWGYCGKRGPDLMSMRMLERGWFEHRQMAFFTPSQTNYPEKYEHLEFSKEQIDAVWPSPKGE